MFDDLELKTFLKDIRKYKFLNREEEINLFTKFQNGDNDALELIVESQLRYVVFVAKKYNFLCKAPVDFMDLIQEGNVGLLLAIEKFKLSKKNRLSTFAFWRIMQKIKKFLEENLSLIKVPAHIYNLSTKFQKFVRKFRKEPTVAEFSEFANITPVMAKRVIEFVKIGKKHISLEIPVKGSDEGEEAPLGNILEIFMPEEKTPIGVFLQKERRVQTYRLVLDLFQGVNKRDTEILKLRFGLIEDLGKQMTLEDIGKKFGLTRERIRQIVEKFRKNNFEKLERLKKHLLSE